MHPCMLRRRPVLLFRETAVRVVPRGNTLTLVARIRLSAKASPLYSRLCNVIETRLVLYAPLYVKKAAGTIIQRNRGARRAARKYAHSYSAHPTFS